MKHFLAMLSLLYLTACATVTAESDQEISVTTTPPGAHCTLKNGVGSWEIAKTPAIVKVDRSFSPLVITCEAAGNAVGSATLAPETRNRAYGNILLLGYPAFIDAATGAGYEYVPASAAITLSPTANSN